MQGFMASVAATPVLGTDLMVTDNEIVVARTLTGADPRKWPDRTAIG